MRPSTVEIGRCIASSVVLPCTTGSSDGSWGSGRAAGLVMESAEMRKIDDVAWDRRVNGSRLRALFTQRWMSSRCVVAGHVSAKHATQISFVQNDAVVETVSPNRSDQPLHARILPRASTARARERLSKSVELRPIRDREREVDILGLALHRQAVSVVRMQVAREGAGDERLHAECRRRRQDIGDHSRVQREFSPSGEVERGACHE